MKPRLSKSLLDQPLASKSVIKSICGFTLLLTLTACSSVVPVSYYQLAMSASNPSTAATAAEPLNGMKTLYIEPVQVASYLNTNALILQTSAVQLHKSSQHQWAEALDLQLQRSLVSGLNQQLSKDWQVTNVAAQQDSCRLLVQLDKFHGEQNGQVQLAGRYHLLCGDQIKTVTFAASEPQAEAGYPAMVTALSQLWQQQMMAMAALIGDTKTATGQTATGNGS